MRRTRGRRRIHRGNHFAVVQHGNVSQRLAGSGFFGIREAHNCVIESRGSLLCLAKTSIRSWNNSLTMKSRIESGILLETVANDALDGRRHGAIGLGQLRRVLFQDRAHGVGSGLAAECALVIGPQRRSRSCQDSPALVGGIGNESERADYAGSARIRWYSMFAR